MFMRLVQVKTKPDGLDDLRAAYDRQIIPELAKVDGCKFASLVQSVHQPDECISLTIWESADAAREYVRNGTYDRLVESVSPYLASTTEWRVQLCCRQHIGIYSNKRRADCEGLPCQLHTASCFIFGSTCPTLREASIAETKIGEDGTIQRSV